MKFTKFFKGDDNDLKTINKDNYIETFNFLAEDENEAISGYDKAILLLENGNHPNKEQLIKDLQFIRKQELEHIDIIKKNLKDIFNYEYGSSKEEK